MKKVIVIEGACDGIGKSSQFKILDKRLKDENKRVVSHHFPSYNTDQALLVEKYLNGDLGPINELSPYLINSIYALDRAITWEELKNSSADIILFDRYTTSSLIYQTALIENEDTKKEFIDWVNDYEYNKLNLPQPDQVIFLTAPFEIANKLRTIRNSNEENDIHEKDKKYLKKVYDNALFLAEYLSWDIVNCADNNNKLESMDEIHEKVYKKIRL